MGYQDPPRENLCHYHIYLENRVRRDHPLRKMRELIDFDFVYGEMKERRDQLIHLHYAKPEILATGPNQVWSWDITRLKGPAK